MEIFQDSNLRIISSLRDILKEIPKDSRSDFHLSRKIALAKQNLNDSINDLKETLGDGYADYEEFVQKLLALYSMNKQDEDQFSKQLDKMRAANKLVDWFVSLSNQGQSLLEKTRKNLPQDIHTELTNYIQTLEAKFLNLNIVASKVAQGRETSQTLDILNSFVSSISNKEDIILLLGEAYKNYGDDASALNEIIWAFYGSSRTELSYDFKKSNIRFIIDNLENETLYFPEVFKYAEKVKELIEVGYNAEIAAEKAQDYAVRLHRIGVEEKQDELLLALYNKDDVKDLKWVKEMYEISLKKDDSDAWDYEKHKQVVEKADRELRKEAMKALESNPRWKDFYKAYTTFADLFVDESPEVRAEMFVDKLSEHLGRQNSNHSLAFLTLYIEENFGRENIFNRFIEMDGSPMYSKNGSDDTHDWSPVKIDEAFGLAKARKTSEKRFLSKILGL